MKEIEIKNTGDGEKLIKIRAKEKRERDRNKIW